MNKVIKILIILSIIYSYAIQASGGGSGESEEDIAKAEAALITKQRVKEIILALREGGFSHSGGYEAIRLLNNSIISNAPHIKDGRSLEIGCGNGAAAYIMQKKGYNDVWAIDINKKQIDKAISQYPSINFKVADVTNLTSTFEDEFFSLIFSFNVTHAVEDKVSMLQRLKAISKDGAIFAIIDYYQKDEDSAEEINSLSGKKMYPIKLSNFKKMMKILGWKIIEESDVTDKYKFWHNSMLEKIAARADMLKGMGYTKDEITIVIEKLQHLLDAIDSGKLGGVLLIAKKV
jgi:ubiquinone/menaquinone biosynthesis C-methylase UbiE